MRILVVEDEPRLRNTIVEKLKKIHYIVDAAQNAEEGLEFLEEITYDLLLLDVVMPGIDGISLCQQLRSRGYKLPILLMTARDNQTEKIKGLDAGADDYLIKPFDWQELLARIRALLRRRETPVMSALEYGELRLLPGSNEVSYGEKALQLTPTELKILEVLLENGKKVFSKGDLIEHLWEWEVPTESTVRSHIKGLRKKLKAAGAPEDIIETVYGLGYRLKKIEPVEIAGNAGEESKEKEEKKQIEQKEKEQELLEALRQSWVQFQDSVFEDINFLEQGVKNLDKLDRKNELLEVIRTTHSLIGLLGSFGFEKAAEICREIETALTLKKLKGIESRIEQLRQVLKSNYPQICEEKLDQNQPRVLIIDEDRKLTDELRQISSQWGIKIEVAHSPTEARFHLEKKLPDCCILELSFQNETETGLQLLAEIKGISSEIPVIVFTKNGDWEIRLSAVKNKPVAFLQKPLSGEMILTIVNQALQKSRLWKIMVVDDDLVFLSLIRKLLERQKLQVTTCSESQQFWQTLLTVAPDLLILDMQMPCLNGIDLCRLVRNDPNWHQLPIIFLTACGDDSIREKFVAAGADDFINKSALASELYLRIKTHLQRVQRLRQIEFDELCFRR